MLDQMTGAAAPSKLTVDELGRKEGIPTSTIRLYVQQGLLPRPVREGRHAYYSRQHVERLRSIRRLLARGFSLTAIRELFLLHEAGGELAELLDEPDEPVQLDPAQFASLFPTSEVDPEVLRQAVELGVILVDETGFQFSDVRHLRNALTLAELGVPALDGLAVWKETQSLVSQVLQRFVELVPSPGVGNDPDLTDRLFSLGFEAIRLAFLTEVRSIRDRESTKQPSG